MEAEAVTAILNRCMADWKLIGSEVIDYEIGQIPDEEKIEAIRNFLIPAEEKVVINEKIIKRARILHNNGIDTFDALHVAAAESIGALFLTTDDLLIKHLRKQEKNVSIKVNNPLKWLMEEIYGDENTK
jgi:predicted nucleic acid-binding protein